MEKNEKYKPEYYENRELSWLKFNERILGEARDKENLLFERLKFLSITASNLDEFFMVRVASLKDMVHADYTKKDIAGLTAKEQLAKINVVTHEMISRQYSTYNRSLLPHLAENGLKVISHHEDLNEEQKNFVDKYFHENVYPVLTPMAVDSSRPFPLIRNKSLNIGAILSKKNDKKAEEEFATVQVPAVLPRIVRLPADKDGNVQVILLEQIYRGYRIMNNEPYHK